jgi:DNA repair exonuclease SbcCD ATPase subunit
MVTKQLIVSALLSLPLMVACAGQAPEPAWSPSTNQPGYAEDYPARVASLKDRFDSQERTAAQLERGFSAYPEALKEPSFAHVKAMVGQADEAGRSGTFAARVAEVEAVQRFFLEEKEPIHQRVAGAVTYAAKKENCTADLYGAAARGVDKAIEQQSEERLRSRNAAHRYIEENQDVLGKPNIEALEKQADEVALASFLANVGLELTRRDLEALLSEAEDVDATLDRAMEEQGAARSHGARSEAERKVAEERYKAASTAKSKLKGELEAARQALDKMTKRIEAARKSYEEALEGLEQRLEQKAETQGSKS